jgi:hypothetical protein
MRTIKIKGNVELIKREKIVPPNDGIHRAGKNGFLKGVHSVMLNDTLIPKGSVGFFYPLSKDKGVKVYVGGFPDKPWTSKLETVKRAYKNLTKLSKAELGPIPHEIAKVQVTWSYKGRTKSKTAFGVVVQRCRYPEKAWHNYAKGLPYDFGCTPGDKNHSKIGYKLFCEDLRKFCEKEGIVFSAFNWKKDPGPKIGDAVYCQKLKRWNLVDPD